MLPGAEPSLPLRDGMFEQVSLLRPNCILKTCRGNQKCRKEVGSKSNDVARVRVSWNVRANDMT